MPSTEYISILGSTDDVAEVFNNDALAVAGVDVNGNFTFLKAADADYLDAAALPANGEVTMSVVARGGQTLDGQVKSSGQFSVFARYQNPLGTTIREEGVSANVTGGKFTDFKLKAKSDFIEVAVEDDSGADQTVSGTMHYK